MAMKSKNFLSLSTIMGTARTANMK